MIQAKQITLQYLNQQQEIFSSVNADFVLVADSTDSFNVKKVTKSNFLSGFATTLQSAYNNSTTPEIVTDATRGALTIRRGSAADTDNVIEIQNNAGANRFSVTGNGLVSITQGVYTSGSPNILTVTGAANTTLTASVEAVDVLFALNRVVQFANGAIATQRAFVINAPTYAFVGPGTSTISNAATLEISGPPIAGTNAVITPATNFAFRIASGRMQVPAGTAALPPFVFAEAGNDTGFYGISDNNIGVTTAGSLRLTISTTQFTGTLPWRGQDGTAAAPAISFSADNNCGLFRLSADDMGLAVNGVSMMGIRTTSTQTSANINIAPTLVATGSACAFRVLTPADTNQTLSTESSSIIFDFTATRQFATGPLATQRAFRITAPTYNFVGSSTITNAATVAIVGAPIAGGLALITNSMSLWIQAGLSRFDGTVAIAAGTVSAPSLFFFGDSNTGIYSSAVDTFNVTAGGVNTLRVTATEVTVTGKLTVTGLIDPTGVEFTAVAANPGAVTAQTIWFNSSDSNKFYVGANPVNTSAASVTSVDISSTDLSVSGNPITTSGTITLNVNTNAITNLKLAQVATATFKGRTTAGLGNVEDLTVSQAKALLDLTGTNSGDQTITLTGDVTGTGTGSFATTLSTIIASGGPTGSASIVPVITYDAKGRLTAVTTATITPAAIGAEASANKGVANGYASLDGLGLIPNSQLPPLAITDTFVVASQAAMLALTAEVGDIAVRSDVNETYILQVSPATVLGNWIKILTPAAPVQSVNGYTGVVSLTFTDVGALGATALAGGDLTGNYPNPTIASNAVTFGKFQAVGSAGFIGALSAGNVSLLTSTQATTLINVFTTSLQGVVPASGGGTVNFLRADGTWVNPTGAPGGADTNVQFNDGGTFGGDVNFTWDKTNNILVIGGAGTPPSFSGLKLQQFDSINSYVQSVIQNMNSGVVASTDIVATSNTGTDTSDYVDMGINGSGWAVAGWTINGANDAYVYASTGNIAFGTSGTAKVVKIFTGGTLAANARMTVSDTTFTLTPGVATSGSTTGLTFTGAANTSQTASVEAIDVRFNLARTVQFVAGPLTTQRAMLIQAPTYAFVGASTVTNAATFAISGSPIAGAFAALTNRYSLWVQSGMSRMDDQLYVIRGTPTLTVTDATLTVAHTIDEYVFTVQAPGNIFAPAFGVINMPLSTGVLDGKAFEVKVTGESFGRSVFYSDGKFGIGPGSSTRDVFVSRSGTNTFRISSDGASGIANLEIRGQLAVGGNIVTGIQEAITQVVATSGSPSVIRLTGAAHTTLTASTEAVDFDFAANRTVEWAAGALATQRSALFRAPTYSFVSASVITNAATVSITGAPIQGAFALITNSMALWVQAGMARFDGTVSIAAGSVSTPSLFFFGDSDTGIYTSAANTFNVTAGGVNTFKVTATEVTVTGKLTVTGLIDPTGVEFTAVAANPGIVPAQTIWFNSSDGNKFYIGSNPGATGGDVTISGLTMATARLLGRTTAAVGAIEEISIGTGLSLSAGVLSNTVTATTPGGATTQVQYNNAGAFAGSSNFTFDGTTAFISSVETTGLNIAGTYFVTKTPQSVSASVTINSGRVKFTGSTASQTLTLPVVSSGTDVFIRNDATVSVTVAAGAGSTVEGGASEVLKQGESRIYSLIGTVWTWF